MKILFLLAILWSGTVLANTPLTNKLCVNCQTVRGRTIDLNDSRVKVLMSAQDSGSSYDSAQYYLTSTISDASVPIGKKWTFLGGISECSSASGTTCRFFLGSAKTTVNNANSAPATAVTCGALVSTFYPHGGMSIGGNNVTEFFCLQVLIQGDYPHIRSENSSSGIVTTYYYLEEDA